MSNYAGTDPGLEVGMYFSSKQYIEKNRQVVQQFTAAMQKSLTYAQEHPDEARAILNSYTKIDPNVQSAMVLPKWPATIDTAAVRKLATLAEQDGLLTKAPDVEALLPRRRAWPAAAGLRSAAGTPCSAPPGS